MKYRGTAYILIILTALLIILEYQEPELLRDPLLLTLPFGTGIIISFMTFIDETPKSSAAFGSLLIAAAALFFVYSATRNFFSDGIIVISAIILMAYSGMVLLVASQRQKKVY